MFVQRSLTNEQPIKPEIEYLQSIAKAVRDLNAENIESITQIIMKLFDKTYPISFNIVIYRLIYTFFHSKRCDVLIYFKFLESIEKNEEQILQWIRCYRSVQIFKMFFRFLHSDITPESNYIISKLFEHKLVDPNLMKIKNNIFFLNYMTTDEFQSYKSRNVLHSDNDLFSNIDELRKDNWKLHLKYIEEGNSSEIAKAIRSDDIETLQKYHHNKTSKINSLINDSLYERYNIFYDDLVYVQRGVTLIEYAAFFGSIQCFKFLLLNGANISNEDNKPSLSIINNYTSKYVMKYAIAGGNLEIIQLCEQNHSSYKGCSEIAIEYQRNDIFYYLYDNGHIELKDEHHIGPIKPKAPQTREDILEKLIVKCIQSNNFEILSFLEKEVPYGSYNWYLISHHIIQTGNLYLVKCLIHENKFLTNPVVAAYSGNVELVEFILNQKGVNINAEEVCFISF